MPRPTSGVNAVDALVGKKPASDQPDAVDAWWNCMDTPEGTQPAVEAMQNAEPRVALVVVPNAAMLSAYAPNDGGEEMLLLVV